jgi:hypothetical protein
VGKAEAEALYDDEQGFEDEAIASLSPIGSLCCAACAVLRRLRLGVLCGVLGAAGGWIDP